MLSKKELRTKYISIRKNISNKEYKSNIIFNKIINQDKYITSNKIALYYNLPSEVQTINLINYSLKLNKEVYLPKVIDNHNMELYRISNINEIKSISKQGIHEPLPINKLDKNNLDLIIIPGICFDTSKNRIGFGSAYYDNYLKDIPNVYKIAICYEEQILKDSYIPIESNDINMDLIITDKQIYK